jgi:tyrosyl-tRNA synthetase
MTEFRSDFLRLFAARGHYYQATNAEALDALLQKDQQSLYVGFDCTALPKSLKVM